MRPDPFTADVTIYTDGSGKSGSKKSTRRTPAGWGFLALGTHLTYEASGAVITDQTSTHWAGAEIGSNNTAELTAILEAAVWAYHAHPPVTNVDIRYDSTYAAQLATGEWLPTSNTLLVDMVLAAVQQLQTKATVTFTHVKSHQGEIWNERADQLAAHGTRLFRAPN